MSRINGFSAKYFPMQSLWIGEILLLIFFTFSGITSTAYMMVLNFLKSTRPSLPLKKAPPLISIFFNGLYTPFGSPVSGGQKPQARRRKPPCSVLFFRFSPSPFSQRELHLQPSLLNSLYDPFGSPCRGQKPQKEGCKPPYSVLGTAAL